jgi:hypothetical protein
MPDAFNEHGIETEDFRDILYDVLDPLNDTIVKLLDAGYSISDVHYAMSQHIGHILTREKGIRWVRNRQAKRASS